MTFAIARPRSAFELDPSGKHTRRVTDKAHLRFIRTLPCLISGMEPVEACHIRYGEPKYGKPNTGMARKPDDRWTVPLTPELHREQHDMNEREFWKRYGLDPCWYALRLHEVTGDHEAAVKIMKGIA